MLQLGLRVEVFGLGLRAEGFTGFKGSYFVV